MIHYISKDALVAEIKRRKQTWQHQDQQYVAGGRDVCDYLLGFLDTPEVKEVDLEKELVDYHNDNLSTCNDGTLLSSETGSELTWYDYERIAKHFFELGLSVSNKAQKEE